MFSAKHIAFVLLIALAPTLTVADVVVSHFEPLQRTQVSKTDKQSQSFGPQVADSASMSLRFDALGKNFDLQLEFNDRVAAGLASGRFASSIEVYRGKLADKPQSWARIVMFDDMPRGIIWDGEEMYAIEAPDDSSLAINTPTIFRLSDVHIPAGTMSCGADSLAGNAAAVVNKLTRSSKTAVATAPGAVTEITMSAIGDFEFTDARSSESAAAMAIATRMNNVDGYFSEQIGVQISLAQPIETHSDPNDPFTDESEAGLLLDEVSEYRLQNEDHRSQGLTHLWTGRALDAPTVGVAWEGVLCESYFGAGLSEGNDGAFIDSLIAAHEIGHNFGAQHDGEPSSTCADETGSYIMSASINGSEEFSACSIAIMQAQAAGAACVTALPTVDVSIVPAANIDELLFGVATDLDYQVSSNGTLTAAGVLANFTHPSNLTLDSVTTSIGSCSSGAGVINCDLGDLAGQSSETITLSVTPATIGVVTITAAASTTDTDERPSNNQHAAQVSVIAAVDLVASAPTASNVNIDANTTVTTNIQNLSTFDATNVTASIVLQTGLQAVSADWSIGTCTVTAQQIDCQASTLAASDISTLTITATGVTRGRRNVTLTIASTEPDTTPANNVVTGQVTVRDPNEEKDDSGGATNPFVILLGLMALLRTRRRQVSVQ